MIILVIWYRYICVLVPVAMLPPRGLLVPLAALFPSLFFIESDLRPLVEDTRLQTSATRDTIKRCGRYQNSAIINFREDLNNKINCHKFTYCKCRLGRLLLCNYNIQQQVFATIR